MKLILILFFSISMWANFFVIDNGKVIEVVNEPDKNIQIIGSNGKILKKFKRYYHKKKNHRKRYKNKKFSKKYVKLKKIRTYTKKRKYIFKKVVRKNHKKRLKDLIVIRTSKRILEFYQNGKWVKNYKVAVGKAGWKVYGKFWIRKKVKWPDWIPTKRIKEENPRLPDIVKGGPRNPLGPRALYLGYSSIRIHGTNNPKSVGKASSHGCFRMKNKDIMELFNMVKKGTPVYIK